MSNFWQAKNLIYFILVPASIEAFSMGQKDYVYRRLIESLRTLEVLLVLGW